MLIYRRTSLLDSSAQTLVNTVNCAGVMGKGIAKEFKEREPKMFLKYKKLCADKKLSPGNLWLWKGVNNWTLNFATKNHWRFPSKIEWISLGLDKFRVNYARLGIREISFPRLGCGNGGLDWNEVRPLMEHGLSNLPIEVYIHDYSKDIDLPEHLEAVAETLRKESSNDPSFEAFVSRLKRATELSHSQFRDLYSYEPISAKLVDDELTLEAKEGKYNFDLEALRGAWMGLQNGLLTKEKAGWSSSLGGHHLLSVLSILPQLRPIEIQRSNSNEPELAVELRPMESATIPAQKDHPEFSWG